MNRILVIDDDQTMLLIVKQRLAKEGFDVQVFSDGKKGLNELTKSNFQLVILDLMMPTISGIEIIDKIRNQLVMKVPILVLSSFGNEKNLKQAYAVGANEFIVKPFRPDDLVKKVRNQIYAVPEF